MKKHDWLWTLMVLPAFITGCNNDDLDITASSTPAVAGNEIVFGAEASYGSGNVLTRTSYGDKYTDNGGSGYQVINWEEGDMVRIDCGQAANATSADYRVYIITEGSTSGDSESTAAELRKTGDVGLQWGTGEHTFYAVYPSPAHFDNPTSAQPQTTLNGSTVTGVIPVTQTPAAVKKNAEANDETYDYIFDPNMDYAYMAARAVYNADTEGGDGVTLHFKPLVTAIEVELYIGKINLNTNEDQSLTLNSVSLYTSGSQPMSGSFSADISNLGDNGNNLSDDEVEITNTNESGTSHNIVTLNLNTALDEESVVLGSDGKCLFTFFIHPSATFEDSNDQLELLVNYTCDGTTTSKTYTIGKEIKAHKKYFFSNITLPDIESETNVSGWFASLDDNIYISQLSIPGAGNAASYNYSETTNPGWYKEQTMSLTEQWNAGVRCFELVSDRASSGDNLANEYLRCSGTSVGITFGSALTTLTGLLRENRDECLIIICNYQPYQSRNAQTYMNNFANTFSGNSYNDIECVKLEATSTVGDIRGKIVFIGRITQEGEDESTSLSSVPTWFTYIKGWGSLKDKWNRRYGDGYYPAYNLGTDLTGTRSNVEDGLFSESSENTSASYPTETNPDFLYEIDGGGSAWVQEWMRVVPESGVSSYQLARTTVSSGSGGNWPGQGGSQTTYTLYITWPGSYTEKYNNIVTTVERAKSEYDSGTGNTLYINSLCGYYVNSDISTSCIPYISSNSVTYNGHTYSSIEGTSGGGNGGDFEGYNEDINTDVYDYLLDATQNNTTGPLGIVMMDYIGSNDAGIALPSLIIQNNFSFPLRTKE